MGEAGADSYSYSLFSRHCILSSHLGHSESLTQDILSTVMHLYCVLLATWHYIGARCLQIMEACPCFLQGSLLGRACCTFFDGVTGAESDCFFFSGPLASPRDGQATAAPVSLSAIAERATSGDEGCSTKMVFRYAQAAKDGRQQYA